MSKWCICCAEWAGDLLGNFFRVRWWCLYNCVISCWQFTNFRRWRSNWDRGRGRASSRSDGTLCCWFRGCRLSFISLRTFLQVFFHAVDDTLNFLPTFLASWTFPHVARFLGLVEIVPGWVFWPPQHYEFQRWEALVRLKIHKSGLVRHKQTSDSVTLLVTFRLEFLECVPYTQSKALAWCVSFDVRTLNESKWKSFSS